MLLVGILLKHIRVWRIVRSLSHLHRLRLRSDHRLGRFLPIFGLNKLISRGKWHLIRRRLWLRLLLLFLPVVLLPAAVRLIELLLVILKLRQLLIVIDHQLGLVHVLRNDALRHIIKLLPRRLLPSSRKLLRRLRVIVLIVLLVLRLIVGSGAAESATAEFWVLLLLLVLQVWWLLMLLLRLK